MTSRLLDPTPFMQINTSINILINIHYFKTMFSNEANKQLVQINREVPRKTSGATYLPEKEMVVVE